MSIKTGFFDDFFMVHQDHFCRMSQLKQSTSWKEEKDMNKEYFVVKANLMTRKILAEKSKANAISIKILFLTIKQKYYLFRNTTNLG